MLKCQMLDRTNANVKTQIISHAENAQNMHNAQTLNTRLDKMLKYKCQNAQECTRLKMLEKMRKMVKYQMLD